MAHGNMETVTRRNLVATAAGAALAGMAGMVATRAKALPAEGATTGIGCAQGRKGDINVRVVLNEGTLEDIIVDHQETDGLGSAAIATLRDLALDKQSLNIDTIAGATVTSAAFLSAVCQAITDAGEDGDAWAERDQVAISRDADIPSEADVVVIGSGIAGMAAAIEAAEAGKNVVVLEKLGEFGGNSIISGAGYCAPGNWSQLQQGVEDSPELMAQDMLAGGDNLGDPELVKVCCEGALPGLEWLVFHNKVSWKDRNAFEGGHSVARETSPNGRGDAVMCPLFDTAGTAGVTMCSNADVKSLLVENSTVCGVHVLDTLSNEEQDIRTKSVIIATGGYGANVKMRMECDPSLDEKYGCTNCIGAMGDGIVMAQAVGAGTKGMEYIQVHPTCSTTTGEMLSTGNLRGNGHAIIVNKEGKRFVEELERRDVVSNAIIAQTGSVAYFVFSKADGVSTFTKPVIMNTDGQYAEEDTLEAACEHFGIDVDALRETIATWNADAEAGTGDSQFNYRADMFPMPAEDEGPWVIFSLCPSVHYTMGGITITPEAQVTDTDGSPIAGLYAAGEVVGGIMGSNRLGCTSYPNALSFGRVAGKSAAAQE